MRFLLVGLLCLSYVGVSADSVPSGQTLSGPVRLVEGDAFDDREPVIEYEGDISYSVKLYVDDFVGEEAIFAFTRVKNSSDEERKYAFCAAFLDADENLIATSSHTTTLKPGVETQLGGLYSEVSAGQ